MDVPVADDWCAVPGGEEAELELWSGVDDPLEWFGRPVLDGSGLDGPAGAVLAARVEEIAGAVLSVDAELQARLSRHDAVSFVAAVSRQIARLEALRAAVAASLTLDAAYHSCDTGWEHDNGTGRACPACTWLPLVEVEDEDGNLHLVPDTDNGEPDERWPDSGCGNASPVGQVGLDLSAALLVSPSFATNLAEHAVDLAHHTPATWTALASGAIDSYRSRVIGDGTRGLVDNTDWSLPEPQLTAEVARREALRAAVEAAALAKAGRQTGEQVRRRVRRLALKADPALARHARAVGVADRRVGQPHSRGDERAGDGGVGSMTLRGPVEDLHVLYAAVDAAARHAHQQARSADEASGETGTRNRDRGPDPDRRTLEQLRFDILTGLGWDALRIGHLACCHRDHAPSSDGPDHGEPTGGDRSAGGDQHFGGIAAPAARPGADPRAGHDCPSDSASAAETVVGAVRLAGQGRRGRPVEIRVTVSLATLLAINDDPADLAGHGPIPAQVARDLAFCDDATWRRLITEPATGALLDYGHTTYRPPDTLAAFVRTRDGTCRFVTTVTPADVCDLDHTDPFDHDDDHDCPGSTCDRPGGTTTDHNLGALSRRPHNARTHHHWQLAQPRPGHFRWISPAGHAYDVEPDPIVEPDGSDDATARADPFTESGEVPPF